MLINFVEVENYPDCLEMFFRFALWDYTREHKEFRLDINGDAGDIILDVKFHFADEISTMDGIKVAYFPDVYSRYKAFVDENCSNYDFVFFSTNNQIVDNRHNFHVEVGYCPYTHYIIPQKKEIDLCFIGTKHSNRGWIKDLPNIQIYGDGWGDDICSIYGVEKRVATAQTKIMVNYHLDKNGSNMRDYEVLAMGTFMLSDFVPNELKGGMVQYSSFDDLVEKIEYYLKHEEEREAIAKRGREIVAPYTYEKRCGEMLEIVLSNM